jgi:hypothetical protein
LLTLAAPAGYIGAMKSSLTPPAEIERHPAQAAFIAWALRARADAKRTGDNVDAGAALAQLQLKLEAAREQLKRRSQAAQAHISPSPSGRGLG